MTTSVARANPSLYPVIMAGGSGTRFWPASREGRPKQFLSLVSGRTMLEDTLERALSVAPADRMFVVAALSHRGAVDPLCRALPRDNVLYEPCGRDTSAAIGWAAVHVQARDPEGVMLVLPADHLIAPIDRFRVAVEQGAALAAGQDRLVTFGIRPDHPATGYGYIRRGAAHADSEPLPAHEVAEFCEKPVLEKAREFLAGGVHSWNSGMFLWRASRILDEIGRHLPELRRGLDRLAAAIGTPEAGPVTEGVYPTLPRKSIDFAVMEKADRVSVVEVDFAWDDLGSWEAVARHQAPDEAGSRVRGAHVGLDSRDLVVVAPDGHLVGTIGVEGLAIVVTPDATLVCPRDRVQEVKALVERLAREGRSGWL